MPSNRVNNDVLRTDLLFRDSDIDLWQKVKRFSNKYKGAGVSANQLVVKLLRLYFDEDPLQRELSILAKYKSGEISTPHGFTGELVLADLISAELRLHTVPELMEKWALTAQDFASMLYWHLIRNYT